MLIGIVGHMTTLCMQVGEFEHIMVLIVDALCQLRAPDAVHGLLVWSRDATGRRMNWIKSSVDVANAKYVIDCEHVMPDLVLDALTEYWTVDNHSGTMPCMYVPSFTYFLLLNLNIQFKLHPLLCKKNSGQVVRTHVPVIKQFSLETGISSGPNIRVEYGLPTYIFTYVCGLVFRSARQRYVHNLPWLVT